MALILHYAVSLAYIFSYPATQAACPTFIILKIIKAAMPQGIAEDKIYSICLEKKLFGFRIKDLMDEGLSKKADGWILPTKKGLALLKVFIFFRNIYGLPIGKG